MLLDILNNTLGKPKRYFKNISTLEYNCPKCAEEEGVDCDNKHNLGISLTANKHVFHCWKCGYKGRVEYLLKKYGSKEDYQYYIDYNLIDISETTEKVKNTWVSLPYEFISFQNMDYNNPEHVLAYDYITKDRLVSDNTIKYLNIGFCTEGFYGGRIIVPSYNKFNKLNFFIARAYKEEIKPSYDAPKVEKGSLILNESKINWNHTVYLVEGYFDLTTLPINTIPLAGKKINNTLLEKLLDLQTPVVIILDPDAKNDSIEIEEQLKMFGISYVVNVHLNEKHTYVDKKTNQEKTVLLDLNEIQKYKGIDNVKKYLK